MLRHLLSRCLHLTSRAVISCSLDAWLHCRCPFCIAVTPSIVVAVALPSCRPSLPLLVDCFCFHRHRRVNVHPPLLPSRSLCCACHRRPSPSRHPSPPLLVDCCIFHVHYRIAVHHRCFVAPTIAIDDGAVALPSRCPCPSPPLLVDCCLAVGSHCNSRANHRCHRCRSVAPFIAVAIVAVASLSRLQLRRITVAPSIAVAIALPHRPLPPSKVSCRRRPLRWCCLQPTSSSSSSHCAGGEGRRAAPVWICP